ncbi:uncharacterized protein TOT_010000644 [Theileria orientalis strain Shintoku]|uniref:RING-type domain-containing protein n=1 Tax=Theileria orientalis strain Shintoku TaxID=869250 RepID=J4C7K2_THEOR|nr:uncharacterized protein TOT_010000644 [Theileria orientalis strain Shintoku]BAM39183.1 uncharacterized protein TOT_010000644 [Theileria orientalis strain Shintoku]|eukprot:XP_009689484.1 uncharacterized protein TOT_010000644 [Theileria orientalis strain Shintoku]
MTQTNIEVNIEPSGEAGPDIVSGHQQSTQPLGRQQDANTPSPGAEHHDSEHQSAPTEGAGGAQPGVEEVSLGSSLQINNSLGHVVEYLVCLKKFRDSEGGTNRPISDPLIELVLFSPLRALMFIKLSILFSIFVSLLLCVPELLMSRINNFPCEKCLKVITMWLFVYRMIVLSQFTFRVLFFYIFSQLDNKTSQEVIYCMYVITQGRGWVMSRKLTSFSYFWYGLGMILHRLPNMCNRRWLYAFIFYILSVNVLRFAVTVILYYVTFPPSHETAKRLHLGAHLVMPKCSYKEAKLESKPLKSVTCGICLDDFADEDILRLLTCAHGFHANCIDLWLSRSVNCPLCMKTLI